MITAAERRQRGFTLIELILVVVIILIATAMAVPEFARSFKGAKLRTSARSVVMASKYARSTAVLKQRQVGLLFDRVKNSIELVSIASKGKQEDRRMFLDYRDAEDAAPSDFSVVSEMTRVLEDGVRIVEFISSAGAQEYDDIYWINYYPNGTCDSFSVRLQDQDDTRVLVTVDPLSGVVKTEFE